MPNRDLKECNRRSLSLQLLSDASERLWYRIITAVDDFGRMEADPEVVFTTCFQRVPKGWTIQKVQKCLDELSQVHPDGQVPVIQVYQVGSKRFLQINSAENYLYRRAKESKYPAPPLPNEELSSRTELISHRNIKNDHFVHVSSSRGTENAQKSDDASSFHDTSISPREIKDAHTCTHLCADSLESRIPNPESREEEPPLPPAAGGTSVDQVVEAWNRIDGVKLCAAHPTGFVAERIRRAVKQHPGWDWWSGYFLDIAGSDFLCGRVTDFQATLDWAIGPKNLAKVLAGNYRNKSPGTSEPCQTRVQRGMRLKPCGQPAVSVIGKRPVCQAHKAEQAQVRH